MGHAKSILGDFALSPERTVNREGFPAFKRDWKEQYLQMLLCNTMSNAFYASAQELCKDAIDLHRYAADEDPFFMARSLIYARNEGFMRLQPIVGLAVLSQVSPSLFDRVFPRVVRIVPDLVEFALALEALGRGQGGRAVKRAASHFLNGLDEYAVMKYAGAGRGYALRDLLRVFHPKAANDDANRLFAYAAGKLNWDSVPEGGLPKLRAFEALKRLGDGESERACELIRAGRLPDNVVTGVTQATADVWRALLPDMPLFSLLRHLVTLQRAGVLGEEKNDFVASRLTDPEAIRRAKILPFRFAQAWQQIRESDSRYQAYLNRQRYNAFFGRFGRRTAVPEAAPDGWLLDALEQAVDASVACMPDLPGRTAVMLDISGSMQGQFLAAGSVLALSLLKKTGGRGRFMLFDTECEDVRVEADEPILRAAGRICARGGTDTGVCLRQMIAQNDRCDTIIIVTDEQQNAGSPFYKRLRDYRYKVNKDARAFVVDVSPYGSAMTPPSDGKTWYCFGWSDQVVSFIAQAVQGYGDLVSRVSAIELGGESGAACA